MSDLDEDARIIRAAYADRVREAFMAFAESLAAGQSQQACTERFLRALELAKKARDLGLEAAAGGLDIEALGEGEGDQAGKPGEEAPEELSVQDQELIQQVLAGTTGGHR